MKKIFSFLFITSVLTLTINFQLFGQQTTEEYGKIVFNAFKTNTLNILYDLKPTSAELKESMDSMGIDPKSLNITSIDSMRIRGLQRFQELCEKIRNDSLSYGVSWRKAKFNKVVVSEKKMEIATSNMKGKIIKVIIIEIFFKSNKRNFEFILSDSHNYGGIWKPGSNLKLIESK
jgi:hypothetical protein